MKKILHILDHLEEYMLVVLMGVMACVVFVQVVFRVIGSSLPWSEELSRYLAVWITFIGAAYGIKLGSHVGVEAIKMLLPKTARKVVELLILAVMVFMCCVILYYSIEIIGMQMKTGQKSPAMRIPMWRAYLGIPIGMVLSIIRSIQAGIGVVREKSEESDIVL